jgi:hypothetical protein
MICLDTFEENQDIEPFRGCPHKFHKHCLQRWTAEHWTCPSCAKEDLDLDYYLLPWLRFFKTRFSWHYVLLVTLLNKPSLRTEAENHLRLTKELTWPHELDQINLPPEDQLISLEKQVWQHEDWMDFLIQISFHPEAELADLKELAPRHQDLLTRSALLDLRPEAGFADLEKLAIRHQDFLSHLERPARIRRLKQLSDAHEIWLEQLETYYLRVRDLSSTAGRAVRNGELENPGIGKPRNFLQPS